MEISEIPRKWVLDTKTDKIALDLVDYLSWLTKPKNFTWLCDENNIFFVRPSVDHTTTIDWACAKSWLLIQWVISNVTWNVAWKVTILCTSLKANWDCKIEWIDWKCPFYSDRVSNIVNPIKWLG